MCTGKLMAAQIRPHNFWTPLKAAKVQKQRRLYLVEFVQNLHYLRSFEL